MNASGETHIFDNVPVKVEPAEVMKRIRMRSDPRRVEAIVRELIEIIRPVARPKAAYRVEPVKVTGDRTVAVGSVEFTSRVLRINLGPQPTVYPFVATCGREVEAIKFSPSEMMKTYCLDVIKMSLAMGAVSHLRGHLVTQFGTGKLSTMNPGEIASWPITQQTPLFSLMGELPGRIGLSLTTTLTMSPVKSRSGIFFPNDDGFESCQLCVQKACTGRKMRYEPELAASYGE